ncbi:hypothetical protein GCM10010185_71780 [Saccharothrix coeruleofusca]|uniref:Uncharacterized protein n=1 Tax=Saccharothrix coeruleofusca TaxID=33919 RepID=A0A918AV17_9PSEU|nr:hypothetical protein GCM10010185_71780 [Saccharothrix coeruleofusca]
MLTTLAILSPRSSPPSASSSTRLVTTAEQNAKPLRAATTRLADNRCTRLNPLSRINAPQIMAHRRALVWRAAPIRRRVDHAIAPEPLARP